MNIYEKLNEARIRFQSEGFKKNGANNFAHYSYFQLKDILSMTTPICRDLKIVCLISFGNDIATMKIVDCEKPTDFIELTSPMSKAALKGCHEVQNLGAVETYIRRYLYMTAFEIEECDPSEDLDNGDIQRKYNNQPKPQQNQQYNSQPQYNQPQMNAAPVQNITQPPVQRQSITPPPAPQASMNTQPVTPPPLSVGAQQERNNEVDREISIALDNINSGIVMDSFVEKAQAYINSRNLKGLKSFNSYCNTQREKLNQQKSA